ncbi:hypothetical protein dsat_1819 [Alkalidesulfovibrio alkalitolerans DSM 16529]|uniref:Uncharacterized protein n=1 Tax=Alkalidesulfovibrio alkalitolerans DSM 16529 TaxID=1121439 RepID=S7TGI7_9BACT|nr:hypothetical protein [Alkalidesulfovibrio alkalitolerans]EPR35715.1 hypothetical protein dsat_1819 [Alkalidesulfovibrio alkalitolerans DSM 16529]
MTRPARSRIGYLVALMIAVALAFYLSGKFFQPDEEEPTPKEPASEAVPQAPPAVTLPEPTEPATSVEETPAVAEKEPEPWVEDNMIPARFMRDLARYGVSRFHPAGTRENPGEMPMNTLTYGLLNARFGLDRNAFGQVQTGGADAMRRRILGYVFQPGFVAYLYGHYADRFIEEVRAAVNEAEREYRSGQGFAKQALRPADAAVMLSGNAVLARDGAKVFAAVAANRSIVTRVHDAQVAARAVAGAYESMWARTRDGAAPPSEAEAEVRRAIEAREAARMAVVRAVRQETGHLSIDDGEVFFLAAWAGRRATTPGQAQGVGELGEVLSNLADRLDVLAAEY